MANWPSKQQHDAVAQRVEALEQTSPSAPLSVWEGVSSLNHHNAYIGLSRPYGTPVSEDAAQVTFIRFQVQNTSTRIGRAYVAGATLEQFDGLYFESVGQTSPTITPDLIPPEAFRATPERAGWLVENSQALRIVDANILIAFKPGTMLPRYSAGTLSRTPGLSSVSLRDANDVEIPGEVEFELGDVFRQYVAGAAGTGVLSPGAFPISTVPMPIQRGGLAGMEIVWPVGGTPYLHVFKQGSGNGQGEHFHLPLTAGLPQ